MTDCSENKKIDYDYNSSEVQEVLTESKKQQGCVIKFFVFLLLFILFSASPRLFLIAVSVLLLEWIIKIVFKFISSLIKKNKKELEKTEKSEQEEQIENENSNSSNFNLLEIIKRIFLLCKKDVFYTIVFTASMSTPAYVLCYLIYSDEEEFFIIYKWLIFVSALMILFRIYKNNKRSNGLFLFGGIAAIFNPVFKISYEWEGWEICIIITAFIYLVYSIKLMINNNVFENIKDNKEEV